MLLRFEMSQIIQRNAFKNYHYFSIKSAKVNVVIFVKLNKKNKTVAAS